MSTTARDIVTAALKKIGAYAPGESLSADAANDGLSELNRMVDSWSNDNLLIYSVTSESPITLSSGVSQYTLGAGGNITTRPMEIIDAFVRAGSTDYPVAILTKQEYDAIVTKTVQSSFPAFLFDDGGYPQRTITLYPVPSTGNTLYLSTLRPLTEFASLDATLSMPPGYEDALVYGLAIRLAPEYGKAITPEVADIAENSISRLKIRNHRTSLLRVDEALVQTGGRFNILTGGYGR